MKKINFWRENGRGRHASAKGSRASRPDQKVGSSVELSGQPLSQKKVFENLRPEPPLKMDRLSIFLTKFYDIGVIITLFVNRVHYII